MTNFRAKETKKEHISQVLLYLPDDLLGLGLTDLRGAVLCFFEIPRHWWLEGIREWKGKQHLQSRTCNYSSQLVQATNSSESH